MHTFFFDLSCAFLLMGSECVQFKFSVRRPQNESCVDFEVAHLSVLMVGDCHTRDSYFNLEHLA